MKDFDLKLAAMEMEGNLPADMHLDGLKYFIEKAEDLVRHDLKCSTREHLRELQRIREDWVGVLDDLLLNAECRLVNDLDEKGE